MPVDSTPEAGDRIDIKSVRGDTVYRDCEVIGSAEHGGDGMVLWVWLDGEPFGVPGRVHSYMPIAEIDYWYLR